MWIFAHGLAVMSCRRNAPLCPHPLPTHPPPHPPGAQVRFSWSTCTPILDSRGVRVRWECEEGGNGGQQTLRFGGAAAAATAAHSQGSGRHSYFRTRKLQRVHAGF